MVKAQLKDLFELKDVKVTASFTYKGKRINISENVGYIGLELNKTEQKTFAQMIKESWIDQQEKENLLKRTKKEIALDKLLRSGAIGSWGKRESPRRRITNCSRKCLKGRSNKKANKYYKLKAVPSFVNGEHL